MFKNVLLIIALSATLLYAGLNHLILEQNAELQVQAANPRIEVGVEISTGDLYIRPNGRDDNVQRFDRVCPPQKRL